MSDIEAWAAIEGDPEVRKFVDNKTLTFKEAKAYVLENIESYRINGYGRYAVREKSNNNLVGMCGFLDDEFGLDLGYRYSWDTWGLGIGTEAVQALAEYGLEELGLLSIVGGVLNENIASEKILIKLLKFCKIDYVNFFIGINDQLIKDNLKKLTEEALQKEIFGAPTFIVNNKIFWGQDRLEYALEELKVD